MATEKSIRVDLGEKTPSDGTLNFDVEMNGLREAEAAMERLQAKAGQFNASLRQGGAVLLLAAQMELLAEKSKTAGASELCGLTAAMVSVQGALTALQDPAK